MVAVSTSNHTDINQMYTLISIEMSVHFVSELVLRGRTEPLMTSTSSRHPLRQWRKKALNRTIYNLGQTRYSAI